MHRRLLFALILTASLTAARSAAAQVTPAAGYTPPDDTQSVKFGVTIFYDYTATLDPKTTDAAGNQVTKSEFQVARTYVNFTGNLSHIVNFRITPDITRESGTGSSLNGSYTVRLKYGFAQFNLDDWMPRGSWVRLGLQQTPIVDYLEGVYRYRFQGTVMPDRYGKLTSSDNGASMHVNFTNNYGDLHFGVYNGEGYNKAEANSTKAFQVRATVRPMATGSMVARGLRVSGFYDADNYVKNAEKRRGLVDLTFEHTHLDFGVMYLTAKDQTLPTMPSISSHGTSVWVNPVFRTKGDGFEALIRYDNFKPSKDAAEVDQHTIAGISYWFPHPGGGATAAILFDYEHEKFKNTTKATSNKVALHGLINF